MTDRSAPGAGPAGEAFVDLRAVTDAFWDAPYMCMITATGPEARVLACNRAASARVADRQVLGRPLAEALEDMDQQGLVEMHRRAHATGEVQTAKEWEVHFRDPNGNEDVAWLDFVVTPWVVDGEVVGAVARAWDVTERVRDRQRSEAELQLVTSRLDEARAVVDTLQRALLPDRLPVLPGLDIAAGYLLAADEQAAGGDWFDAVPRADQIVLVVGDVVGHGVAASAAMGRIRSVLLDHLDAGEPIAGALGALHRLARRDPDSFASTVCLVELDLATGTFEYITAGHPPPLVVAEAGASRYLVPTGAGLLGDPSTAPPGGGVLAPGEVLLLYTDGIVELPGSVPRQATIDLARAAERAVANQLFPIGPAGLVVDRVARQTIETLVRLAGHHDDVTLLAARRRVPPYPLDLTVAPSEAAEACRLDIGDWLGALEVMPEDTERVLHAVGEVVQNVVDHAHRYVAPAPVHLAAELEHDGTARVRVEDHGRWDPDGPSDGRGFGLPMAAALVDELEVVGGSTGTTVTVGARLHRAVGSVTPGAVAPLGAPEIPEVWSQAAPDVVEVGASGPIDAQAAVTLATHLALATAPGQPRLRLDLRSVTLLGSAAVQAIVRARSIQPDVEVIAPAGSVAQHVLTLAAIPFLPPGR